MQIKNFPRIWMYHYVRPHHASPILRNLHYLGLDQFIDQLDAIDPNTFLTPETFLAHLNEGVFPPNQTLLTFDDGLLDHYHYVLPELKKRGLKAIFFVPTLPLIKHRLIKAHKIHCLSAMVGYPTLIKKVMPKVKALPSSISQNFSNDPQAQQVYYYDAKPIASFKYALNFTLPNDLIEPILDDLLFETLNQQDLFDEFYMNLTQLKELVSESMAIGLHGHTHTPFSVLSKNDLAKEFSTSIQFFTDHLRAKSYFLSYPFGEPMPLSYWEESPFNELPIHCAFLDNHSESSSPYSLPRIDCFEINRGSSWK